MPREADGAERSPLDRSTSKRAKPLVPLPPINATHAMASATIATPWSATSLTIIFPPRSTTSSASYR
jgi:hypothetical protein